MKNFKCAVIPRMAPKQTRLRGVRPSEMAVGRYMAKRNLKAELRESSENVIHGLGVCSRIYSNHDF
jgi:hypothetical protein